MFFVWNALVNIAWFIISGIVFDLFLDTRYQAKDLYDSMASFTLSYLFIFLITVFHFFFNYEKKKKKTKMTSF